MLLLQLEHNKSPAGSGQPWPIEAKILFSQWPVRCLLELSEGDLTATALSQLVVSRATDIQGHTEPDSGGRRS